MFNIDAMIQQFMKQYSFDGYGDKFEMGDKFTAVTLGIVVNTDDPLETGRLGVYCPSLNDNPKKLLELPWTYYSSPYMGNINNDKFYRGTDIKKSTSKGGVHYGMWSVPELGSHVLIMCIDGDPRRRVFMGCLPEHRQTNTMGTGRFKYEDNKVDGPFTGSDDKLQPLYDNISKACRDERTAPEYKTRFTEYQITSNSDISGDSGENFSGGSIDQKNKQLLKSEKHKWIHDTLGSHGYNWSGFKGIDMLSSQGITWSTPRLHTLLMDDREFNSRIKLRTGSGHQIIMDDTNERIYISTIEGNNYIEMDVNGNIDIYSSNRVSIHSEKDMNFTADGTVRILGKEGVHIYAGIDEVLQDPEQYNEVDDGVKRQTPLVSEPQVGEVRIHSQADMHIRSNRNIRQLSIDDTYTETMGNKYSVVAQSEYNDVGVDYNLQTIAGDVSMTVSNNLNENIMGSSKRYTEGDFSVAGKGSGQLFSFEANMDIGSLNAMTVKSSNSSLNLESQGYGSGQGTINLKTPTTEFSASNDGIALVSANDIKIGSAKNFEAEAGNSKHAGNAEPLNIQGIPATPNSLDNITMPPVSWDYSRQTITADECVRVCYNAGFRGDNLVIAVAIAMAESGLRSTASNAASIKGIWGAAVGIFQVRVFKNPDNYTGLERLRDNRNRQLEDPNNNANFAFRLFNEATPKGAWSAGKWEVLKNDGLMFKRNMPSATSAVQKAYQQYAPAGTLPANFAMPFGILDQVTGLNRAVTKATGSVMQLTDTVTKIQAKTDLAFKSLTDGIETTHKQIVNKIDETINKLAETNYGLYAVTVSVAKGLQKAASGDFSFELPFSINIDCLIDKLFQLIVPKELLALYGSLQELNQRIKELQLAIGELNIHNLVTKLKNDLEALLALGLPLNLEFKSNLEVMGCQLLVPNNPKDLNLLDIPSYKIPSFNTLVDRIMANNSINGALPSNVRPPTGGNNG